MFKDAEHALNWAFNMSERPIVKMSAINHMQEQNTRPIENMILTGLGPQDRHGQAAQIIGMVEQLPDLAAVQFLKARFGRRVERFDIPVVVYRGCAALGLGLNKREEVYKIVKGYFVAGMTIRQIKSLLGCRTQHAFHSRKCLYDTLDVLNDRALAEMTYVLERHGLIESSYVT
jgi:hypothetical protein